MRLFPRRLSPGRLTAIVGLSLSFAAGCGADPAALDPCADLLAECLSNQQTCVADGETARCERCAAGTYAAPEGGCAPIQGTPLVHEFETFTVEPGEEIGADNPLCQSWTLNNPEEIWVNTVELDQDERSHHSIWMFVPADVFDVPDGTWNCLDHGYNYTDAAIAGGVLYAQSTQAEHEVQRFPNGAAVRIAPYSRIIGDIHLLNTTSEPVTGNAKLTLYALTEPEVNVKLVPFQLHFRDILVPARASTRLFGECDLEQNFQLANQVPFGMDLYFVLPHTHQRGRRSFIELLGGPSDGQRIFDIGGYTGEARGQTYDQPVKVSGARGFRWGCEYDNPSDITYEWGYNQEMCQFLGFADMTVGFTSTIRQRTEAPPDGDMLQFTGPCQNLAVKWDFDKPGGPPPP